MQHQQPLERCDPRLLMLVQELKRQSVDRCAVVKRLRLVALSINGQGRSGK